MKATARKILALIMAMVMCLSLAVPAFAYVNQDVYDYDANVDTTGWTNATQTGSVSNVYVNGIEEDLDGTAHKGDYTVYGLKAGENYVWTRDTNGDYYTTDERLASGNVTDASTTPTYVKVELTKAPETRIGFDKTGSEYTVSSKADPSIKTVVTVDAADTSKNSILDLKDSDWKAIDDSVALFTYSGKEYKVQGYFYQEQQTDGDWVIYAKLATVDENNNFKSNEWKYFKSALADGKMVKTAAQAAEAMQSAVRFNEDRNVVYGTNVATYGIVANEAAAEVKTSVQTLPQYTFTTQNPVDVTVNKANAPTPEVGADYHGNVISACVVDSTKDTGSFQVSIVDLVTTKDTTKNPGGKDVYVTSVEDAQTILADQFAGIKTATLESVTAASGNYFNVTVKRVDGAAAMGSGYAKNVVKYGTTAVLIDATKAGFYNADSDKGSNGETLAAGTEQLGPVAVKKSDVPDADFTVSNARSADTWWVFTDADVMKANIKAKSCKADKTVPYVQLRMNPIIDDKVNTLVVTSVTGTTLTDAVTTASAALITVDPLTNWWTYSANSNNAKFLVKDTLTVEKKKHGTLVETTETTPATCKKAGTQVIKKTCTVCNEVVSEETKEVPVVSDPVVRNTAKDANDKELVYFTTPQTYAHYIEKRETTTAVSADKKQTVTTTTYTCNLGEVHDELTRTETINKADLQHAGAWNLFSLKKTTAREEYAGTVYDIPGYTAVQVVDSDIEHADLPLNREAADSTNTYDDAYFNFDVRYLLSDGTFSVSADNVFTKTQGIVLKNVYSSATALPTTKAYAATLTVKDLNKPEFACQEGSATLTVELYDVTKAFTTATLTGLLTDGEGRADAALGVAVNATNLEQNLKDGKVTLLKTYTENAVIKATAAHTYGTGTTGTNSVCTRCGAAKPVAEDLKITATAKDIAWTGKEVQPSLTVTDVDGFALIENVDYVVSKFTETEVGEYVVTVKGIDAYAGNRIQVPVKIVKAKSSIKLTKATITANKKKKVTKKVKVKKTGDGAMTWKTSGKVSGVTFKNGKFTLKKNNKKKGTIKVTASMAESAHYKACKSNTVKITIKAAK